MSDPIAVVLQSTTMTWNGAAVGGISSIKGVGGGSSKKTDTSTFASGDGMTYSPGLIDNGEVTITFSRRNNDDAGQAAMLTSRAAYATVACVITLPMSTANVATFNAFVVSISNDMELGSNVQTGEAKIQISGPIVWS